MAHRVVALQAERVYSLQKTISLLHTGHKRSAMTLSADKGFCSFTMEIPTTPQRQ